MVYVLNGVLLRTLMHVHNTVAVPTPVPMLVRRGTDVLGVVGQPMLAIVVPIPLLVPARPRHA